MKDRLNAVKNPYAHLKLPDITIEKVRDSMMLWDPIHFLESCPSSDGACAIVVADHDTAAKHSTPAWVLGTAMRSELGQFPGRDTVRPQAGVDCSAAVYQRGRDHQPAAADRRRRALRAVQLVRADVARRPRPRRSGRGLEDDRRRLAPR